MSDRKIVLNKDQIRSLIEDNFGCRTGHGWSYTMVVRPSGRTTIGPMMCRRPWDPWGDDDYVVDLPAPFGDGSDTLEQVANDFLQDTGMSEAAEAMMAADDITVVEAAERLDPMGWVSRQWDVADWVADEWLKALNGKPNDLSLDLEPSPFRFEFE